MTAQPRSQEAALPSVEALERAILLAAWGYDFGRRPDAAKIGRDLAPKVLAALAATPPEQPSSQEAAPLKEALISGLAYAMARADLPGETETNREYATRLAPLVIESGYLDAARAARTPFVHADDRSGHPRSQEAALAATLDKHWLAQQIESGVAYCTCGAWQFDARSGQHPLPTLGERFLPFSEHVAAVVLAAMTEQPRSQEAAPNVRSRLLIRDAEQPGGIIRRLTDDEWAALDSPEQPTSQEAAPRRPSGR